MPNRPSLRSAPIPSAYAASNPEKREAAYKKILIGLSNGNTRRASAGLGGVTYETLRQWMGEDPDFCEAVEIAEAVPERAAVNLLMQAVKEGDLKAIMFWLERRRPVEWGRVDRVDVMVRRAQMEEAADMLSKELGREVSVTEIQQQYDRALKALPAGRKRNSAV